MEVENEKSKLSNRGKSSSKTKEVEPDYRKELSGLLAGLELVHTDLVSMAEEIKTVMHINEVLVEMVTGVNPGRKQLRDLELVKLRNEGVSVRKLAEIQQISIAAMQRKLKELREAGVLSDGDR